MIHLIILMLKLLILKSFEDPIAVDIVIRFLANVRSTERLISSLF
jgi:hypothetical protein